MLVVLTAQELPQMFNAGVARWHRINGGLL